MKKNNTRSSNKKQLADPHASKRRENRSPGKVYKKFDDKKQDFRANKSSKTSEEEDEFTNFKPNLSQDRGRGFKKDYKAKDNKIFRKTPGSKYSMPKKGGKASSKSLTRINKYLAHSGIGSRREVEKYILSGNVKVNGKVMTDLAFQVGPNDVVQFDGQRIKGETKRYYVMNKPKDFITTTSDDQDRRTVMDLIGKACSERIYPVGRLDRNTTGVLLFTNDGDMAKKLTHPSHGAVKIYHVSLDEQFSKADFEKLTEGIDLEDGFVKPDKLAYIEGSKRNIGVEIHSGKNRIVRRMFAELGYEVEKLDRVFFAGLTKKMLKRGQYRELDEKEVSFLKMLK
ncbi:MAG: pseudouridine synthase [Flavobacteriales bacterium]